MKSPFLTVGIVLATVGLALDVRSDDPQGRQKQMQRQRLAELGNTLVDTLALSYKQRLVEYEDGRSQPDRLIAVNRELYDAMRSVSGQDRRVHAKVIGEFIARAKSIEAAAQANLDNGRGTSMDLLDAKSARLRAEIELARVSYELGGALGE